MEIKHWTYTMSSTAIGLVFGGLALWAILEVYTSMHAKAKIMNTDISSNLEAV